MRLTSSTYPCVLTALTYPCVFTAHKTVRFNHKPVCFNRPNKPVCLNCPTNPCVLTAGTTPCVSLLRPTPAPARPGSSSCRPSSRRPCRPLPPPAAGDPLPDGRTGGPGRRTLPSNPPPPPPAATRDDAHCGAAGPRRSPVGQDVYLPTDLPAGPAGREGGAKPP